ncbi:MAG: amidohydrolase family protein [Clostridiaceae bacterium]|nr:amidohydrolase family protein [Clostridiaceae bacterium]
MRIFIKNGMIYDGGGGKPFQGGLLVENDRLAAVGGLDDTCRADQVIDAAGLAVTPGFIDTHRHGDLAALSDPDFGKIELAQGITTAFSGNCGLSAYPNADASRQEWLDFIEPCLGKTTGAANFARYADYMRALGQINLRINLGGLVGSGAVKTAVKGFAKTPFTPDEMARAQNLLADALASGAFGVSSGIMYVPDYYSTKEEWINLLKPLSGSGGLLTCHVRGEGDSLVDSVAEAAEISRLAGVPLNISHFKSVGVRNWNRALYQAVGLIEKAGADITVDAYPYTGGATTLMTLLPPCVVREKIADTVDDLSTAAGVERVRRALAQEQPGWDNMIASIGWERIIISSVNLDEDKGYVGKNIAEITGSETTADPVQWLCDLVCRERGKVGIILMSMAQEDVDAVLRLPYSMVISDSLYGNMDSPHPRLYGSFAKIIRDYVQERHILPLETAVYKMSGLTARRFGIKDRGRLIPGYFADINIFDPAKFRDQATFTHPRQLSAGLDTVLVNGRPAYRRGVFTEPAPGSILIRN